jgi:hypothetical protein
LDHVQEVHLVPKSEVAGRQVQEDLDFVLAVDLVDVDFLNGDVADVETCASRCLNWIRLAGEVGFDSAVRGAAVLVN